VGVGAACPVEVDSSLVRGAPESTTNFYRRLTFRHPEEQLSVRPALRNRRSGEHLPLGPAFLGRSRGGRNPYQTAISSLLVTRRPPNSYSDS
jgi:hypothetical protein